MPIQNFITSFSRLDLKTKLQVIGGITLFILLVLIHVVAPLFYQFVVLPNTKEVIQTKIIKAERIDFKDSKIANKYRYFTEEGTYINGDNISLNKYNSADIHNQFIQNEGKTCTLTVHGIRNEFFSLFKDLTKIENCR